MKTNKLKRVVIREELFSLTNDTFEAIILNQLLYWTDRVEDFDKFIVEEKERDPEVNIEQNNGWIYKSANELIDECMLTISATTMRRYLQSLINKGFISERRNPNNKWDRVMQYRVNLAYIIDEVKKLGYDGLSGYRVSNIQNEGSEVQNEGAIPEITNIDYNKDTIKENILKESKEKVTEGMPEFVLPNNTSRKKEKTSAKKERFTVPSVDDIKYYAGEKGLKVDAEAFYDYYESKGWKVGNSRMKDWKAALRNWCRNEKKYNKNTQPTFSIDANAEWNV